MAVARKQESVLASLSELREIEEQRVADERAAVEAAELAVTAAREAEARRKEEAIAATARAEHDAKLAIEHARLAAEREARLKIEATEAAERTRQQAVLAETRFAQEMELRRAEVARKRPTWMVAVTAVAMLAAFALIYVAIDRTRASEQAKEREQVAKLQQKEMRRELDELTTQFSLLETELTSLSAKTTKALDDLAKADTEAKRKSLAEEIRQNQAREREIRHKQELIEIERTKKKRKEEIKVPQKCLDNAVC
jgi:hypothetical protein